MAILEKIAMGIRRVNYGLETKNEFLLRCVDKVLKTFSGKQSNLRKNAFIKRLVANCKRDDAYHIKDIKFPLLGKEHEDLLFASIFEDTFGIYYYTSDDKYDEKTFDKFDSVISEGPYGLVNEKVNVLVKPGDIVIDAGAWVGDFSAYASVKGATSYAFEPTPETFLLLKKTAELNKNIIPVNKGLSDENIGMTLFVNTTGNSGGNTLIQKNTGYYEQASSQVQTVRLDDFVRENNLPCVDFIKADIEGFERHMLAGAQETLAKFAPKLALCTYHLPDDPEVMAKLILQANPKYNIVQKRKKLFASVPE